MMELRPCPFCGGEAKLKKGFPGRQNGRKQALVQCRACGCRTPMFYQYEYESVSDVYAHAVEAWNRRTPGEQTEDGGGRLSMRQHQGGDGHDPV